MRETLCWGRDIIRASLCWRGYLIRASTSIFFYFIPFFTAFYCSTDCKSALAGGLARGEGIYDDSPDYKSALTVFPMPGADMLYLPHYLFTITFLIIFKSICSIFITIKMYINIYNIYRLYLSSAWEGLK